MRRLCYSPGALARLLGVNRVTVHRWLNGRQPVPVDQAEYIRELVAWVSAHPPPPPPPGGWPS